VKDLLEVPRSLVIKIRKELDGDGRSWTVSVYVFNSDMVNVGPTNEEDPPANNGDPHPFHGPVVPGELDFVAHIADQFINNPPQQIINMQVPDQGSQNNSVVAQEDSTTAPLFTQGQHPSEEIEIEEDQMKPIEIESSGKEKENGVQADKELEAHNGSCLKEQHATLMNINPSNAHATMEEVMPGMTSILQQICVSAQLIVHFKVGLDGSSSISRVSVGFPGLKETVLHFLQFIVENSKEKFAEVSGKIEEPMSGKEEYPVPVITINNNNITKVYKRKGTKIKSKDKHDSVVPKVFAEPVHDYESVGQNPEGPRDIICGSPASTSKRKATPVSVMNLRRSKRNTSSNKGFKPITPTISKSRKKLAKAPEKSQQSKQQLSFFSLLGFPDLAEVDRIIASGSKASPLSMD
jgi:hypothetical protein